MKTGMVKMEAFASLKTWQSARTIAREADTKRAYLDLAHEEAIHEDRLRSGLVKKIHKLLDQGVKGWR